MSVCNETLGKIKKISPSPLDYIEAKKIVAMYESSTEYKTRFYVDMGFSCYAVGHFGGFKGDRFILIFDEDPSRYIITPLQYVFEEKQENMLILYAGSE